MECIELFARRSHELSHPTMFEETLNLLMGNGSCFALMNERTNKQTNNRREAK
jgi:hypothetical protein